MGPHEAATHDPWTTLDEEGDYLPFWKETDCKDATFLFCANCKTIGVICEKCNQRMILAGHMGFAVDGTQHMRTAKTGVTAELTKPSANLDKTKPRFETLDLNKDKLRLTDWEPCGPDGSHKHFWRCETCKTNHAFGRK